MFGFLFTVILSYGEKNITEPSRDPSEPTIDPGEPTTNDSDLVPTFPHSQEPPLNPIQSNFSKALSVEQPFDFIYFKPVEQGCTWYGVQPKDNKAVQLHKSKKCPQRVLATKSTLITLNDWNKVGNTSCSMWSSGSYFSNGTWNYFPVPDLSDKVVGSNIGIQNDKLTMLIFEEYRDGDRPYVAHFEYEDYLDKYYNYEMYSGLDILGSYKSTQYTWENSQWKKEEEILFYAKVSCFFQNKLYAYKIEDIQAYKNREIRDYHEFDQTEMMIAEGSIDIPVKTELWNTAFKRYNQTFSKYSSILDFNSTLKSKPFQTSPRNVHPKLKSFLREHYPIEREVEKQGTSDSFSIERDDFPYDTHFFYNYLAQAHGDYAREEIISPYFWCVHKICTEITEKINIDANTRYGKGNNFIATPSHILIHTDLQTKIFGAGYTKPIVIEDKIQNIFPWKSQFDVLPKKSVENPFPTRLDSQFHFQSPKFTPNWISIEGGTFRLSEENGNKIKRKISNFSIQKNEVTVGEYRACVDAGYCEPVDIQRLGKHKPMCTSEKTDPNLALNCASFYDAKMFCEWVGGRLPTEAEWEYVARSQGKERIYTWGSSPDIDCQHSISALGTDEESGLHVKNRACGVNEVFPVCSRPKGNTDQDVCDMVGNLWEWTNSSDTYVSRGGSFYSNGQQIRIDRRQQSTLDFAVDIGFRCIFR